MEKVWNYKVIMRYSTQWFQTDSWVLCGFTKCYNVSYPI